MDPTLLTLAGTAGTSLVTLLGEHPEAADELRDLVEGWQRQAAGGQQIRGDVRMEARAEGNGRAQGQDGRARRGIGRVRAAAVGR
ncbi:MULTISPECIES: hypothetical protein [unclassified Streptomyces]|uniref:hypothetical protein n=1 Tax=unclassified Streptomyces TaxID=2593676 RepID=UPI0035DE0271